jgi:hypothetical protein
MLTTIFYYTDEFCKFFSQEAEKHLILHESKKPFQSKMKLSEVMTILIYWHQSGYKDFKSFYTKYVLIHLRNEFSNAVSYSRFVELIPYATLPLFVFAKCLGSECTGTSFVDSTKLSVCDNRRIYSHKVFKNLAQRGQTSMGWFFGFKLHLVTDQYGNIIDFTLTSGNVHDSNKSVVDTLIKKVKGILVGDKGYIGLFQHLFAQGITLLHRLRSNMKNKLISLYHKALLRKRGSIIETAIGILKEHLSLEHSRHRSSSNFLCHIFSCLISYAFFKACKVSNAQASLPL